MHLIKKLKKHTENSDHTETWGNMCQLWGVSKNLDIRLSSKLNYKTPESLCDYVKEYPYLILGNKL